MSDFMNINKARALVVLSCIAAGIQGVGAEPATYRDGELLIDRSIVVGRQGDSYYRNLSLQRDAEGTLRLAAAQKRRLALLGELELDIVYSDPLEVELGIGGYKSMSCVDLEPVATARAGEVFHVLIAETPPDPLALCAQGLEPFELTLRLEVGDLAPGDYLVLVNNEPMEFTIEDLDEQ